MSKLSVFLKRTLRILFKSVLCFIGILAFYFLMAWMLSKFKVNGDFTEAKEGVKIFVRSNGVHCDVIVPVRTAVINWNKRIPVTDFDLVDTGFAYAAFGWGDKGFYIETPQWSDLKVSTACKALFFLSSTAMHVTYWRNEPTENGNCKMLTITTAQYEKMVQKINASFNCDISGHVRCIAHGGYTSYDKFYEAKGTYSLFNTCNVWTGNTLSEAGVKVGYWTPFDWCLLNSIK